MTKLSEDSAPIRVLHLMERLAPSGMERMLVSGAAYMNPAGTSLVVGQGTDHPFADEIQAAGYQVATIPPISRFAGLVNYRRLVQEWRPDVIHIHTEGSYLTSVLASQVFAARVPLARTIHNIFVRRGVKGAIRNLRNRIADRFVARVVACSPEVADHEGSFGRRVETIWNWVAEEYFLLPRRTVAKRDAYLIVGNCGHLKNHDMAIAALVEVGTNRPIDVRHVGSEAKASPGEVDLLDRLEAQGNLTFRGPGNPIEQMADSPTMVVPSIREGMCIALAEGIVAGLRALVADAPGLRWAEQFPTVTMVRNDPDDWRAALASTSVSPSREQADVTRFHPSHGAEQYMRLYRQLSDGSDGA